MANRILVTGANGQLGSELRHVARSSYDSYIFTDVVMTEGVATTYLDITDRKAVRTFVTENDINIIINCAAYTNVDRAEEDKDRAMLLNATAPENLAQAMKEVEGLLIHISTDYVFGGDGDKPYTEEQPTAPKSVYGSTKLRGEEAIMSVGCRHVIIRTAWLYSTYGNNFLKTMLRLTSERESISVVNDQIGTPTYAADLADTIVAIIEGGKAERNEGIYHFSNEGVCSWYDFAREIAHVAGNTHCEICPCLSSEYPSKVTRPAYSVLDKSKIRQTFNITIPYWTDSVERCINKLISEK
ncbi:MAG: dTDP-4-dehydrorhamnose reductase [Alistipes sp.]|nr:dTDP-4-dehydrorhamnose reductase [Alistipes sp.]